jgi:hypothetical protein
MQLLTLSSWQQLMHVSMDTSGNFSIIFFLTGVLLGAYFMMNLFVAVIKDKFDVSRHRVWPYARAVIRCLGIPCTALE